MKKENIKIELPRFAVRAGTLLRDVINGDGRLRLTAANITDDLALYHLATNEKYARRFFTHMPDNVEELVAKKREDLASKSGAAFESTEVVETEAQKMRDEAKAESATITEGAKAEAKKLVDAARADAKRIMQDAEAKAKEILDDAEAKRAELELLLEDAKANVQEPGPDSNTDLKTASMTKSGSTKKAVSKK